MREEGDRVRDRARSYISKERDRERGLRESESQREGEKINKIHVSHFQCMPNHVIRSIILSRINKGAFYFFFKHKAPSIKTI